MEVDQASGWIGEGKISTNPEGVDAVADGSGQIVLGEMEATAAGEKEDQQGPPAGEGFPDPCAAGDRRMFAAETGRWGDLVEQREEDAGRDKVDRRQFQGDIQEYDHRPDAAEISQPGKNGCDEELLQ